MVIDKLTINYNQDIKEEEKEETDKDGKTVKVTVKTSIEGTGTVDEIYVKRLKRRRRAAIFGALKGNDDDLSKASLERQAQFGMDLVAESVCDSAGKLLVTIEDLDDPDKWPDAKFNAYVAAIVKHQSPSVESVAKNSSSTTNATP